MGCTKSMSHGRKHFSLKFSLISVLMVVFMAFLGGLLLLFLLKSQAAMNITADKIMHEVSFSLNAEVNDLIQPISTQSKISRDLVLSKTLPSDQNDSLVKYSYTVLRSLPQAQMMYFARPNGDFIISKRNKGVINSEIITQRSTNNANIIIRNKAGKEVSRTTKTVVYNPQKRPWYKKAVNEKQAVWSDPYVFKTGGVLGITRATPIYISGHLKMVVGVDITLNELSRFVGQLKPTKNSITMIIDASGHVVAYPKLNSLLLKHNGQNLLSLDKLPNLAASLIGKSYMTKHEKRLKLDVKGETYIGNFVSITDFAEQGWHTAVISPITDYIGLQRKNFLDSIIWGVGIMFFCVIFIWLFANRFSKSIRVVSQDLLKLSHLKFNFVKSKRSRITEVITIQRAVEQIKNGLQSFEKYVPAKLVKQLIIEEKIARLGGDKKELVVFFSDIKDFTSISEHMMPTPLLEHLCEYFELLTHTIWDKSGTIDKFIGDAVMAFWGAPSDDDNKIIHSCQAALEVQLKLRAKNIEWQRAGKPPLPTRIGLHVGTVIVGNVGSSDRINYTTLGDPVNVSSRLESIAKVYSCNVVVSDPVYQVAKEHFSFLPLDVIVVKGKCEPVKIYEMMIPDDDGVIHFDCEKYVLDFDIAFHLYSHSQFVEALEAFELLKEKYQRPVTDLYINRCKVFIENPPEDWDGVWRFKTK
jgi:adenylate cyclase